MRRPLKPFVTEYKGTNRRPKDGAGLFGVEPDASPPEAPARKAGNGGEPKASAPKTSSRRGDAQRGNEQPRYNGGPSEDSYEAAMRAADALFSGTPARDVGPSQSASSDEVFWKSDAAAQPDTEAAPAGTGRILRVLDEEPDPALLKMEAERTPKRRGRKPGSKNKPKVNAFADASTETDAEPVYAFESRHDLSGVPAPRAAAPRIVFFPPVASRGKERFAWVRTKLRAGEAWKRRLPKVIW